MCGCGKRSTPEVQAPADALTAAQIREAAADKNTDQTQRSQDAAIRNARS